MTNPSTTPYTAPLPLLMPEDPHVAGITRAVLASLPLSYAEQTHASAAAASVVVIDGVPGWPDRVASAAQRGALGVLVVEPEPADCSPLLATLTDATTSVVLDTPWASNPVMSDAAEAFRLAADPGSRLECRIILHPGRDLRSALLHQLTLVRALLGPVAHSRLLTWSERGYAAEGTAGRCAVDLTLITTSAVPESAQCRLLTSDGSVELIIPSPDTAQPALLTTVGPTGALLAPTVYESGHRASWRRLHALITADDFSKDLADLQALQDDTAEVTSIFNQHHTVPAIRP
jgi:hypothetical protein